MSKAVIQGDYVDLRFIRTRSVCQLVIEIPIERGEEIVRMFGTPRPSTGVPVAVARLNMEGGEEKPDAGSPPVPASGKPKRHLSELPLSQQAALACEREEFREWLRSPDCDERPVYDSKLAASAVREICRVKSRSEFDTDVKAAGRWQDLYEQFQASRIADEHDAH